MDTGDVVRYWSHPQIAGVELMHARFVRHAYARHSHDTFAIGVTEVGTEDVGFANGDRVVGPGGVVLINPGEVHTGRGVTQGRWGYSAVYVTADVVRDVAAEAGLTADEPAFGQGIAYDREVGRALLAAHRAAGSGDALASSGLTETALARLLLRYAAPSGRRTPRAAGERAVRAAGAALAERMAEPPSLTELAELAGTGKFALLRAFHAEHGLPPYRYLDQLRVREAQRLLAAGRPPAEVAATVGYVDQAHLTRNFRRIVGLSPGAYRAAHGWSQPRTRRGG
jgi:AraC-like DNA-binding protein